MEPSNIATIIEGLWDMEWAYLSQALHSPAEDRRDVIRAAKLHRDRLDTWIEMNENISERGF